MYLERVCFIQHWLACKCEREKCGTYIFVSKYIHLDPWIEKYIIMNFTDSNNMYKCSFKWKYFIMGLRLFKSKQTNKNIQINLTWMFANLLKKTKLSHFEVELTLSHSHISVIYHMTVWHMSHMSKRGRVLGWNKQLNNKKVIDK